MKNEIIPVEMKMANAYIIKNENSVIVDTGVKGNIEKIFTVMRDNGIEKESLKAIIITHAHDDHYGNAAELKKITGAEIIIHKKDHETMKAGENVPFKARNLFGKFILNFIKNNGINSKVDGIQADTVISGKTYDLSEYGVDARIIHTPGHTPGSVCVAVGEEHIIIGDLLMGKIMNPAKPGYPIWVDDISSLNRSIKKMRDMNFKKWYPAHGKIYSASTVMDAFTF